MWSPIWCSSCVCVKSPLTYTANSHYFFSKWHLENWTLL